jgi:TolA-binding protein
MLKSLNLRTPFVATLILLFIIPSGYLFAQGSVINEKIDYHRGIRLYDEGMFIQAETYLLRYLKQFPDGTLSESSWYYLAKSRAAVDSVNVTRYYEAFYDRYPKSEWAADFLIELGHYYRERGDHLLAIDYFERAFEIEMPAAKAAPLLFWIAELYIKIGDHDAARSNYLLLSNLYRTHPLSPQALYARGRLYLEDQQFAQTTEAFELLRERHQFSLEARRIGTALGESYFRQGRYQEAIISLRNALANLEDKDQQGKAVLLIAESYNYLDQLDEASTWYLRFVNQHAGDPNERLAHYGLGWVYHKQQIYHWAAQSFGRAVESIDDEITQKALYYKAVNEKLSGRYDLALQTFQQFGNRYSTGYWAEKAYYEWAIVHYEIGDNVSALDVLLNLIRSGTRLENGGDVYTLLGEAYFANNEFGRAVDAFEVAEKMADIDPAVKLQARFQRGWVLFQNHAFEVAQPIFAGVYAEQPTGRLAAEALFWNADSYYNMERYDRAAELFTQFLNRFPSHEMSGAAQYSLGWSYFRIGQYDRAVEPLRLFLQEYKAPPIALFPYDVDTKLRLGDSYYALRRYQEAITYYEQAISSPAGGDYALFQVANSYYRAEQTYEAVSTFRRLLRTYPESRLREQSLYNIGYIYFLAGNFEQAISEFQLVIRQYRGSNWAARAQYNIGDAYYNAGQYSDAIEAYRAVMRDYPRSPLIIEAVNGIQYATIAAGEADNSSQLLESFLQDNPQAGTADRLRFRQAEFLLRTADYAGAIEAFRDYIRVTNSTQMLPEAWYNLADAYRQQGNLAGAVQAYQTLVTDYPRSARAESALLNLGSIAFERGQFRESLDYYTQLRNRTNRLRNEANVGQGDAYLALGQLSEAEQAYGRALQQNAAFEPGKLGLAKVKLRQQDYADALARFGEIVKTNTLDMGAEAQYWIGFIYQQQQRFEESLQAFSQVRVLYESYEYWVSMSYIRTAEIHRARGETGEARAVYLMVTERYPGTEAARLAQRILQGN